LKEYRDSVGELFAAFSEVAEGNPFAQFPTRRSADEISNVSSDNFLLAEPYTKWMVAQDAVNQGAAIVMTSVGMARELSIPESNWIYLKAYADADDLMVSERPNLSASQAQGDALNYVVDKANLKPEKVDLIDLYSCFPIAVTSTCGHLGITPEARSLTLTGGLPFFGGPGNNYSLHAIAEVVWRLRSKVRGDALIAANGGYLSKHSIGAYSKTITDEWLPGDFRSDRGKNLKVSLTESPNGEGVVESYSAIYQRNKQYGGYIVGRLIENNLRFLAVALPGDARALSVLFGDNPIGTKVTVTHHEGINRFTVA
jgi:acetyl-CoA C-acetyltransferase